MEGVSGRSLTANITQYSINLNNQFRFKKGNTTKLTIKRKEEEKSFDIVF